MLIGSAAACRPASSASSTAPATTRQRHGTRDEIANFDVCSMGAPQPSRVRSGIGDSRYGAMWAAVKYAESTQVILLRYARAALSDIVGLWSCVTFATSSRSPRNGTSL